MSSSVVTVLIEYYNNELIIEKTILVQDVVGR